MRTKNFCPQKIFDKKSLFARGCPSRAFRKQDYKNFHTHVQNTQFQLSTHFNYQHQHNYQHKHFARNKNKAKKCRVENFTKMSTASLFTAIVLTFSNFVSHSPLLITSVQINLIPVNSFALILQFIKEILTLYFDLVKNWTKTPDHNLENGHF